MAKTTKKSIIKSASVDAKISSAIESLMAASNDGNNAIAVRSKDGAKFAAEVKKLTKKRATLIKRKKTAATKVKKSPDAETRKALRTVEKDLASTKKDLDKSKVQKSANAGELASLKAGQRKVAAYLKVIGQADKVLNKPKKKARKKPAKKAVAKA